MLVFDGSSQVCLSPVRNVGSSIGYVGSSIGYVGLQWGMSISDGSPNRNNGLRKVSDGSPIGLR